MSKFRDALQRGREAHEDAERAKQEIRKLLEIVISDVRESTDGRVNLVYGQLTRRVSKRSKNKDPFGASLFDIPSWTDYEYEEVKYHALYIDATKDRKIEELCTVRMDQRGYPVTIEHPGHSNAATDRESLEDALVDLLEDPNIAGKIARAAAGYSKTNASDEDQSGPSSKEEK